MDKVWVVTKQSIGITLFGVPQAYVRPEIVGIYEDQVDAALDAASSAGLKMECYNVIPRGGKRGKEALHEAPGPAAEQLPEAAGSPRPAGEPGNGGS